MTTRLRDLPKYLVLDPVSTVRIQLRLDAPACEIDVELDNPKPGRSFVLLLGQVGGPYVQRVRLAGRARIFFDPQRPGAYELLIANPQQDPVVLRMRGRNVGEVPRLTTGRKARSGEPSSRAAPTADPRRRPNRRRRPRSSGGT
jgi:hypothetical protein